MFSAAISCCKAVDAGEDSAVQPPDNTQERSTAVLGALRYQLLVSVLQFFGFSKKWRGDWGGGGRVWREGALYANLAGKLSVIVKRIAEAEHM